ncbi:hypothetical protein AX774_g6389 [Zancudomyces culisetae]|uniref:Uncharacterized protein n=1 Tax=Zancudomyces culisetae TaxID=1213189 RepID=A0A1R1PGS6_ZANCU|nr:hypothetical protein AX774_g6389 [Zancudomyces culisetae]|eukprot:OMH80181.1 hypothetical protein AX774_g6389 [Zancudomyces culisetae]
MSKQNLTIKFCWLLAIYGFLRPSDIERIDDSKMVINKYIVKFVIVGPKEKRSGNPIEKVSIIHAHSDYKLCPVVTYRAYKKRIATFPSVANHPILDGVQLHYLIRNLKYNDKHIGAQRISKHINSLMSLLQLPESAKLPKARAFGSTRATKLGATYDDVIAQGF